MDKAEALGLQAGGAERLHGVGKALGTPAEAEAPPKAEQPGRRGGDGREVAGDLVAGGKAVGGLGGRPGAGGVVGRVAGDKVQGGGGDIPGAQLPQVPADGEEPPLQGVFPDGALQQGDGLGQQLHGVGGSGGGLPAEPKDGDNAAAGAEVAGPVPPVGGGKVGKEKGIGAKAVLPADPKPQRADLFKGRVHGDPSGKR